MDFTEEAQQGSSLAGWTCGRGVGLLAPKRGPSLKSQARHLYRSRFLKAKVGCLFPEWQVRSLRLGKLHRDHCHTESPHGRPVR